MSAICTRCGYRHSDPTTAVRVAGSRFASTIQYRADFDGAPLRHTREEARADLCEHYRKENR